MENKPYRKRKYVVLFKYACVQYLYIYFTSRLTDSY